MSAGHIDFKKWHQDMHAALLNAIKEKNADMSAQLHDEYQTAFSFSNPSRSSGGLWTVTVGSSESIIDLLRQCFDETPVIRLTGFQSEIIGTRIIDIKIRNGLYMSDSPVSVSWNTDKSKCLKNASLSDINQRLTEATLHRFNVITHKHVEEASMAIDERYIQQCQNKNKRYIFNETYKNGYIQAIFAPIYINAQGKGSHTFLKFIQAYGVGQRCSLGFGQVCFQPVNFKEMIYQGGS